MKKTITTLAMTSLIAISITYAHAEDTGRPPAGGPRGEFRKEIREERKEIREEFRENRKEAVGEFREGMKERREWNMASGTATGTKPTPWKNLKEDMKDMRKDFRDDMRNLRDDMRAKMPPMSATATAAIATKLGISVDVLNAQLASGTKLKEIIKDKITPEQMREILPPRMATFTKRMEEGGFFNRLRNSILGEDKQIMQQTVNEFGEVTISTSTISVPATPFWKRFFNF